MEQLELPRSNINIYDADFIAFYVCHNKKDADKKSLDDCIRLCDEFIYNINKNTNADYYCGYLTKGRCFRYIINPDYKSNRDYSSLPDYTLEVRQHMIDKHHFVSQEGYEADDLVVSFAKQHTEYECLVISPDKDILGLLPVSYNPKEHKYYYNTTYESFTKFWSSMIIGDTADAIKGVPGRGKAYVRDHIYNASHVPEDVIRARVLRAYIEHFGEYEGIKEFTKNYLSLKILDNVRLEGVVINKAELSEQETRD